MALTHNLPVGSVIKAFDKEHTLVDAALWNSPDNDRLYVKGGGWVYPDEIQDVVSVPSQGTTTGRFSVAQPAPGPSKQSDEFNEAVLELAVEWGRDVVFQHKGKTRIVTPDDVYTSAKDNRLVVGEYEGGYRTFRIDKIENEVVIRPL